ncbi:hypothetical protein INR49_002302 [Caranx melampygus]|nr:hypothetical protein INR49_002302 [Caranx melampygus]
MSRRRGSVYFLQMSIKPDVADGCSGTKLHLSKKRESVGYIVLDLRSVQEVRQEPRWFPLLNSKYTKQRPALLLALLLENDHKPSEPSPDRFKARKAPPRQGQLLRVSPVSPGLPRDRAAARQTGGGTGPRPGLPSAGTSRALHDMFVLSITVAFATKLEQVRVNEATPTSKYRFYSSSVFVDDDVIDHMFI